MNTRSIHRHSFTGPITHHRVIAPIVTDLKRTVGTRLIQEFRDCLPVALIHRALDEAVQTAISTEFPHLFFPELAEEKVRIISAALCGGRNGTQPVAFPTAA